MSPFHLVVFVSFHHSGAPARSRARRVLSRTSKNAAQRKATNYVRLTAFSSGTKTASQAARFVRVLLIFLPARAATRNAAGAI